VVAWWEPRLARIAAWVAETEAERRAAAPPAEIVPEVKGTCDFLRPGGPFALVGRADRIERRADGRLAILDYKTGQPPSQGDVDAGLAAQLPLEAAMALHGAFGPGLQQETAELAYWQLSGGFERGKVCGLYRNDSAKIAAGVAAALKSLLALIDRFDDPAQPYLAQPDPGRAPRFPQYDQLARVGEWAAIGGGEE
jgi:ATP-dependent helicase/nuclease subunit B